MLEEYVKKSLDKIAREHGITNYTFETGAGSKVGDNYVGYIVAVTITGEKNQKEEKLHLICKLPPITDKPFESSDLFIREVSIYSKVLPKFVAFQHEKGLSETDSFLAFPKVYASEANVEKNQFYIIMENLRLKKFDMWPKEKGLPIDHELLVMKELGKLHGVSFAFKDQRPDEFENFKSLSDVVYELCRKDPMKSLVEKSVLESVNVLTDPVHKQIMENFSKTYLEEMKEWSTSEQFKQFAVVGHSDCWTNNFLFQCLNENDRNAQAVCFLDWQITNNCSPVMDLFYHIFGCTDKSLRDEHYTRLLSTYYEALSGTIKKLGSDPEKLFSYTDFQNELKKCHRYAFIWCPMIQKIRLDDSGDVEHSMTKAYEDERHVEYSKQVNDLFADFVKYGYIE